MIDFRQAQQILLQQARSFGKEELSLESALGRVLAEPLRADRDYPPFNRATMDGYALRTADLRKGISRYRVIETIFAGQMASHRAGGGECYKIMTGAPVPEDCDRVIRREDVEEWEGVAVIRENTVDLSGPANIAWQGEDISCGQPVLTDPCRCEPPLIGLLASLGQATLTVEKLPRVALLTTGDEVVPAGGPVKTAQIRNSNRWLLQSFLKKEGIDLTWCEHAPDDPDLLRSYIGAALSHDLLILCGGVSAGDADYVPAILEESGVKPLFHKIAMRPGKPVWCGLTPTGTLVIALPGNPFSCMVGFLLLIRPWLQACFGLDIREEARFPLAGARKKRTSLDEFFPVSWKGASGRVAQMPLNSSGDIRMGLHADWIALHPAAAGDLEAGEAVICYPI